MELLSWVTAEQIIRARLAVEGLIRLRASLLSERSGQRPECDLTLLVHRGKGLKSGLEGGSIDALALELSARVGG